VLRALLPPLLSRLRTWDRLAADRVDRFVANSRTVARRIRKYYGRDSVTLYPPVDVARFRAGRGEGGYWLAGGRLVPYKRFDVIVQAFTKLGLPLKVFGVGPEMARLRAMAGPRVEFLGRVREEDKPGLYAGAIAYLHPQEEDFGITAVEAMAAGRPVLAFGRGGGAETVIDGVTGTHLEDQTWEELAGTVLRFDAAAFDPETIRRHALRFDTESFKARMHALVEDAWTEWQAALRADRTDGALLAGAGAAPEAAATAAADAATPAHGSATAHETADAHETHRDRHKVAA
jgi:glycosyltransferase involved in cell wall biosynthesis